MSRDACTSSSEWFSGWFHTPYYELLYGNRNYTEAQTLIEGLYKSLSMKKGDQVLDIPCGWGRHSQVLHNLGLSVTGVDINPSLIERAIRESPQGIRFKLHDMRVPYPEEKFDYVLNLFTSLGYFDTEEENRLAIRSICSALRRGGHLVIDFLNAKKIKQQLIPFEEKELQGITFRIHRRVKDNFVEKDIQVKDQSSVLRFSERVMLLELPAFSASLQACGMQIEGIYGGYQFEAFDSTRSDRLLIIARKV